MREERTRNTVWLVAIFLLTLLSIYFIFLQKPVSKSIKLGLDLQSGTHLLLALKPPQGRAPTGEDVERVLSVLKKRTDEFGTSEPIIQKYGNDRVIVDLPAETNPKKAIDIVTKTAYLEFKEQYYNPQKKALDWRTVLTGDSLVKAIANFDSNGNPEVNFELNKEGGRAFATITERNRGKPLGIFLDGKLVDAPNVAEVIAHGSGMIHGGGMTIESAQDLAKFLQAGALPVPIDVVEAVTVSPTLGREALEKSLWAGFLGLGIVILFMVWNYRLPGLMADVALVIYALLLLFAMVATGSTLTLPGIAGFILSVGMAVDANVLIFERLKEELWSGKTIRHAVETGFHRAWSSIFDSHMTTFIGAAVLFYYGSSSVKGFGLTLAIGTVISFFTAIYITRPLLDFFVIHNIAQRRPLFGE